MMISKYQTLTSLTYAALLLLPFSNGKATCPPHEDFPQGEHSIKCYPVGNPRMKQVKPHYNEGASSILSPHYNLDDPSKLCLDFKYMMDKQ